MANGFRTKGADTIEDINKCLNCTKPQCTNCLDTIAERHRDHYRAYYASGRKRGGVARDAAYLKLRAEREEKIKALWAEHKNDHEISVELDLSPSMVARYRRGLGLPKNTYKGRHGYA